MAYPTGIESATNLAVLIPEIWGEKTNNFFRSKKVMTNWFTDRSSELVGGGDTLYTPNFAEMAATAKTNGAAVTLVAQTETKVDLVVDQWFEVSFVIEDREAAQVKQSYSVMSTYASNAGYSLMKKLEVAIAALFGGFSQTIGASTSNLADSQILAAIATLETNDVDMEGVAFFLHPNTFYRQVQSIDKFSLAQNAPVNDPVGKKPTASLYGIPVFVSSNIQSALGSRLNALAHRDAIHFATASLGLGSDGGAVGSGGVRIQSSYKQEYLGTLTTADILYGVIENRDTAGYLLKSHLTLA